MKKFILASFTILAFIIPASASEVVKVYDGDTITVRSKGKDVRVRFACIDAPEMSQKPYGTISRDRLAQLLPVGSEVEVFVKTTDQYGRVIGEVVRDGQNINLQMVKDGQAFVWTKFADQCNKTKLLQAEKEAQSSKIGVWQTNLTRPWQYRYDNK